MKCQHRWVNADGKWHCKDCLVKGRAEWSFVFNVYVVMPIGDYVEGNCKYCGHTHKQCAEWSCPPNPQYQPC